MTTLTLTVEGMSCGGCEKSIRNALLAREGVNDVNPSHEAGTVTVDFDEGKIDAAQLATAIEDSGFDVVT